MLEEKLLGRLEVAVDLFIHDCTSFDNCSMVQGCRQEELYGKSCNIRANTRPMSLMSWIPRVTYFPSQSVLQVTTIFFNA